MLGVKLVSNAGIAMYAGAIGLVLFFFAAYALCLALANTTSNESIRTRWNAKHDSQKKSRLKKFSKNAGSAADQE